MIDYKEFISCEKSMLIAPAGFGKTYTIAECLKYTPNNTKQLILTHTHAGVASIKEKVKKEQLPTSKFHIETITSFAQKYVLAFYTGNDIPKQEDGKKYYSFLIQKATALLSIKPIQKIVSSSYDGVFVDEYQDCTQKQHALILALANYLPTHIFGDFLQGIFGFKGECLVDLENNEEMCGFTDHRYALTEPQRWLNGNNRQLGLELKQIREVLINKQPLNLKKYASIETYNVNSSDLHKPHTLYQKKLWELLNEESVLLLHPNSTSVHPRIKIIQIFSNRMSLIESIDDKSFYKLANLADNISNQNPVQGIKEIAYELFNTSGLNIWFNAKGFKNKRKEEEKLMLAPILSNTKSLEKNISFLVLADIFQYISTLNGIKCYRKELCNTFISSLKEAEYENITVSEAMTNKRNTTRRSGRKIFGKCIGTTLLTKGLEFDTVAILDAHKFEYPKHLYVALTRASKRLLVFTQNMVLHPN